MKHLKPPQADDGRAHEARRKRRTAFRFGFSAIIASFVVLTMLILGAMFQEEYEEGFVRIVTFAVRLATPEEVAQAEAQGPIPAPLPAVRPDTPVVASSDWLLDAADLPNEDTLAPGTGLLILADEFIVETPDGLELLPPSEALPDPDDAQEAQDEPAQAD